MSGVEGVGAQPAVNGAAQKTKESSEQSGLNKDEFLQLLVGQLKNQNPLSPVGSQEFMSQMAAFSTLEQVTNLAVSNEELNGMISTNQSLSLVGHQVSYLKEDGTSVEGTVESVDFGKEGSSLTIGGVSGISPGQVSQVK
ncbi:MAG TPA: flagellar hook capping FlgD N-terminal domain-containing protein [Solirubrobacterales bacterium]|nr:flagellar hook capping FlgD N-terminal domain-containing protein [Solirubrobacterales bacterium]